MLSTSDTGGRPSSAGVTYGATGDGSTLYVMTRNHLEKARNIAVNPRVALVVPVPRLLWFLPPATIQLTGHADSIDWTDREATEVFDTFRLGRRILHGYRKLHARGERRTVFVRIALDPVIHTYLVGVSLWRVRTDMRVGASTVVRPP